MIVEWGHVDPFFERRDRMHLEDNEIKLLLAAVWGAVIGTVVAVVFLIFVGV